MREEGLIRELACIVRGRLDELAGPRADEMDGELAAVLNREPGEEGDQVEALLSILGSDPATHATVARALERVSAGDREGVLRSIGGPPGHGDPGYVPTKLVCPRLDFTWYRRTVGQKAPRCPSHELELVPAGG